MFMTSILLEKVGRELYCSKFPNNFCDRDMVIVPRTSSHFSLSVCNWAHLNSPSPTHPILSKRLIIMAK